jgi:REP element-mobilizing transposase RayT
MFLFAKKIRYVLHSFLKGYDYSQAGMYFVTICVKKHICLFGKITNGKMMLNEYGQIAYNEWAKTSEIRPNVQLDAFIIMPNHIHGIIVITENDGGGRGVLHTPHASHLPNIIGCECNSPLRSPSNTIGAMVRGYKSAVTKQLNQLGFIDSIWQRSYWEHVIRNQQSHQRIANYVFNNPANWENDELYMN